MKNGRVPIVGARQPWVLVRVTVETNSVVAPTHPVKFAVLGDGRRATRSGRSRRFSAGEAILVERREGEEAADLPGDDEAGHGDGDHDDVGVMVVVPEGPPLPGQADQETLTCPRKLVQGL